MCVQLVVMCVYTAISVVCTASSDMCTTSSDLYRYISGVCYIFYCILFMYYTHESAVLYDTCCTDISLDMYMSLVKELNIFAM